MPDIAPRYDLLALLRRNWDRLFVWSLFLFAVYLLQHFLLIAFLTFLLSYFIRGLVVALAARIAPGQDRPWLERGLTVGVFAGLVLALLVFWSVVGPKVVRQGRMLVYRVEQVDYKAEFDNFLKRTVGAYLFHRKYGGPGDERYETAWSKFQEQGRQGEGLYRGFATLRSSLLSGFESEYDEQELHLLQAEVLRNQDALKDFDRWFLDEKAPQLFERQRENYIARWLAEFSTPESAQRLQERRKDPDFEKKRDGEIRERILADIKNDPVTLDQLTAEWEKATVRARFSALRATPDYQDRFRDYYERRRQENPRAIPYDYPLYTKLNEAYPKGRKAFLEALGPTDEESTLAHEDFVMSMKQQLAEAWWQSDAVALSIRQHLGEELSHVFAAVAGSIQASIRYGITIPIQIGTALVLCIFITFDLHTLRKRALELRGTRIRPFLDEIVPELAVLARLIGRSFQAQALIALCNSFLTFVLLKIIGVESEYLLAALVFVCSFIPVLGVFLSSAPIVLTALLQTDGSMLLAFEALVCILIIHLVESTILNPRITGNLLHVHPVTVLIILAIGEYFFGVWGLLLGVPIYVYVMRVLILNVGIPGIAEPRLPTREPIAYVNGRYVGQSALRLDVSDVGFVQGATITDFCRTFHGKLFRLEEHLTRFFSHCAAVGIEPAEGPAELAERAHALVRMNSAFLGDGQELGLVLFATPGLLPHMQGWEASTASKPTLGMHTFPLDWTRQAVWLREGAVLRVPTIRQVPGDSVPAGLKQRSRLHWYLAEREVHALNPIALPLLLDQEGFVTETATANVVLVRGNTLLTPRRTRVLSGVSLHVVEELARASGLAFEEADLRLADMEQADEILLCNTTVCIAPVRQVNERTYTCPGPIYQQLVERWSALVELDIRRQVLEGGAS